jgi:FkbM family methyltransferase
VKSLLKSLLKSIGYEIHRIQVDQHTDPYMEQLHLLKSTKKPTIIDAGANVGNMTIKYKALFPDATIHAFEPFHESYSQLVRNTYKLPNIHTNQLGLADHEGTRQFHANQTASTNSLLQATQGALKGTNGERFKQTSVISVELVTLDSYALAHDITHIDILKLDVQGAEPQVLQGAARLIASGSINIIFTEIMAAPFYQGQQQFHEALVMYHHLGFNLYNFYDLSAFEGPLRQLDAIFIRNQQPSNQ